MRETKPLNSKTKAHGQLYIRSKSVCVRFIVCHCSIQTPNRLRNGAYFGK